MSKNTDQSRFGTFEVEKQYLRHDKKVNDVVHCKI